MDIINTTNRLLEINLLQIALGLRAALPATPSNEEWQAIFTCAKNHSLIGLLYGGIERLPKEQLPPRGLLIKWFGLADYQKKQKLRFDAVMAEFASLLAQEHIPYVVFKGLAVGAKYPQPELRTVGDIDFYVPPSDFDRAVEIIERNLGKIEEKDYVDKHFAFDWKDIRFEMHYQMETFGYRLHQEYYGRLIDDAIGRNLTHFEANGSQIPMLPAELDLIHVFKHWMGHLIGEGVGLRQTTDLAVLINAYKGSIDIKKLKENLSRIGYLKAFDAVVMLVEKYYTIGWPEYWQEPCGQKSLSPQSAARYADVIFEDVMRNGNFGRSDYKYRGGLAKRLETTARFFRHCMRYYRLAPKEISCMIPKRIAISVKAH